MTSPQQTYGPPTGGTDHAPLVVPFDPQRGWAGADLGRRTAAVLALPLALLLSVAATADGTAVLDPWAVYGWIIVGPATFYSLARVLRPEPRGGERTVRHLLAGAGTAFGVPTLACLLAASGDDGLIVTLGTPAFLLGVTTAIWGLGAFAVRLADRR